MRSLLAFAIIAALAAPAIAQDAQLNPVATLSSSLSICERMFAGRTASPAGMPADPNLTPTQRLAQRGKLSGLVIPSADELKASGWSQVSQPGVDPFRISRKADWGVAGMTLSGIRCSVLMMPADGRLPDGANVVATAEAWIARAYPSAVRGEDRILKPDESQKVAPETETTSTWTAPDGIAVSLHITRVGPDVRPKRFSIAITYGLGRPPPFARP